MYDYSLSTEHETATDERIAMVKRTIERKRNAKLRTVTRRKDRALKYALQGRVN